MTMTFLYITQVLQKCDTGAPENRSPGGTDELYGILLLDHAIGVNGPDFIICIFVILEAISQLRFCRGFGR